jgi:hypothetical protein
MPSWFDITGLDENAKEDEKGLLASVSKINSYVLPFMLWSHAKTIS